MAIPLARRKVIGCGRPSRDRQYGPTTTQGAQHRQNAREQSVHSRPASARAIPPPTRQRHNAVCRRREQLLRLELQQRRCFGLGADLVRRLGAGAGGTIQPRTERRSSERTSHGWSPWTNYRHQSSSCRYRARCWARPGIHGRQRSERARIMSHKAVGYAAFLKLITSKGFRPSQQPLLAI